MEKWKDIPWYEWLYQANTNGVIKRLKRKNKWKWQDWKERIIQEKILIGSIKATWYIEYSLRCQGEIKYLLWHRIIGFTFIKNTYNKPYINHKNWVKTDNRVENLEWCTQKENIRHSYDVLGFKWPHYWKFWKDNHRSKPIKQLDLEWNLIKVWDNSRDIYRTLNIRASAVWACCNWKQKQTKWFTFKYL